MSTIVNNPAPVQDSGNNNGFGFLIGTIILIAFVGILLYFAIPAIKNMLVKVKLNFRSAKL